MSKEEVEFKVPKFNRKIKSRKSDLPSTASKVDIPLPTKEDVTKADSFGEDVSVIPPVPYKEPGWSRKCEPDREYSFEVEKNGVIIEKITQLQKKSFWLFGRLPNCDINITHPTSSRYHAILQYRPSSLDASESGSNEEDKTMRLTETSSKCSNHSTIEAGWYIYDLNSTHGTFLNKQQINPRTYVRVRVGYMIKLGLSSRTYILQGPSDDEEEPTALTITELKEQRNKQLELRMQINEMERKDNERIGKLKEPEGISWGMQEDADEETDLTENPYASSNNEELFLDDPKKTLRGYFEREGYNLEYKVEEVSPGTFCCKVELPIDDANGRPVIAEVATHKGKKKDVVAQCALEACRILDRHGLLRQANHAPRRRYRKESDSDGDDDFLDRTGDVERRREKKLSKEKTQLRTYTDLIHDEARILERLEAIEHEIQNAQMINKTIHLPEHVDDLDKYLATLSKDKPVDKFVVSRLRLERKNLQEDLETVKKLIKATKPINLDEIIQVTTVTKEEKVKQKIMPLFGKRNKLSNNFGIRESTIKAQKDNVPEEEYADIEEGTLSQQANRQTKSFEKTDEPASNLKCKLNEQRASSSIIASQRKRSVGFIEDVSDCTKGKDCTKNDDDEMEENNQGKKKRSRNRIRDNKSRNNVDIDDASEIACDDKNVEWAPPSDQTGDGITFLNEKYGY